MDPVTKLANNLNSGVRLTECGSQGSQGASAASTFKWKVDVPEFVPRFSSPCTASSNAASHWATSTPQTDLPATGAATQFYFDNSQSQNAPSATAVDPSSLLFENVDWIVSELQNNPENFDRLTVQFLNFLQHDVQPPLDASGAAVVFSSLIDAAVMVPNFAYLCVRLMAHLHDHFSVADQPPSSGPQQGGLWFSDALLDSLQKEFNNQSTVLLLEDISAGIFEQRLFLDQSQRLSSFLNVLCMFATLLSRHGRPYVPLSKAIYHIMEGMVKRRSDSFVRNCIQTLKTVGAHLESTEKMGVEKTQDDTNDKSTPLMDKLIDLLECIGTENCVSNTLSENTRFMIRNLRGVRRHWAYVAPPPPSPVPVAQDSAYYQEPLMDSATYLNASASSLPPYDDNGAAYYDDPYGGGVVYFTDANSTGLTPDGGAFDGSSSGSGGNGVFLTSAEAAFFEEAASGVDDHLLLASARGGLDIGGAYVDSPPSTTAHNLSFSSDEDTIAEAYEEFLRNMQQQQTPPQKQFGR